jgi:hypothetical protein
MKRIEFFVPVLGRFVLATIALVLGYNCAGRAPDQHFNVLQIGTRTYKNVTVTTKGDYYIVFSHSEGLASAKVAQMTDSLKEQLGYLRNRAPKATSTNSVARALTSKAMALVDTPQLKGIGQALSRSFLGSQSDPKALLQALGPNRLLSVFGALLLFHLFFSFCLRLLCQKAGTEPGFMVWLPILQAVPMFRAAAMSGWWSLVLFVPFLSLVPALIWPFKIAQARGKSRWVGVLLLVPVTNLIAFLYLAFSVGAAPEEEKRVEIMTLEAA